MTRFKGSYGRKIPVVDDRSQFHQGGNHDLYQNRSSEYLESVPEAKARQQSSRYVSEGQKIHYNIHVQDQSLQMKLKSMAGRYKKEKVDRSDKIKINVTNRKDAESNGSEEDGNFYEQENEFDPNTPEVGSRSLEIPWSRYSNSKSRGKQQKS